MTEHPNRFVLERYCVGDLASATHDRTEVHLESCTACKVRVASFQEQAAHELGAQPPAVFMAQLSARKNDGARRVARIRRWAGAGGVALAAAAAFALVPRTSDSIALRGTGMQIHRNRDGLAKLMDTGDRIRAGDALRVVITLPHPAPVDVWFVDAKGRVDRFLPNGATRLEAGERALPDSALVNTPCTDTWVVVGVGQAATNPTDTDWKRLSEHGADESDDWIPKGCLARRLRCE